MERVYKAAANSKVFTGFSFTGGKLGDYLRSGRHDSDYSHLPHEQPPPETVKVDPDRLCEVCEQLAGYLSECDYASRQLFENNEAMLRSAMAAIPNLAR